MLPGLQRLLLGQDLGIQVAVRKIQLPISVFDLRDQLHHRRFELGRADVGVDPRDQHAVIEAGNVTGAGDPVEIDPLRLGAAADAFRPQGAWSTGDWGCY